MKIPVPQKLIHKGLALVAITLVFEFIFISVLTILLKQSYAEIQRQVESRNVVANCDSLSKYLYKSVEATLSYHTTHNEKFKRDYEQIEPRFRSALSVLSRQISERRNEPITARKLQEDGGLILSLLEQAQNMKFDDMTAADFFNGKELNRKVIESVNSLGRDLDEIVVVEQKTLSNPANPELKVILFIVGGLSLNIFFAVGSAFLLTRSTAKRLETLMENTFRLSYNQVLLKELEGDDEIAAVDQIFHLMAHQITEASRKTRSIVENSVDVICSLDGKGRFLSVNKAVADTWGYEPDELLGSFVVDRVRAEDKTAMHKWIERTASRTSGDNHECVIVGKTGKQLNVLWSAYWSESDKALLCIAHDFTERKKYELLLKESEEHLQSLIKHMPVGVLAIDESLNIKIANSAIEQLFDYATCEVEKLNLRQLLTKEKETQEFIDVISGLDLPDRAYELRGVKHSGQKFPIRVTLNRIHSNGNKFLLLNLIDITEEKLAEQLRKEIGAMVTHDLRSPLTSLQGFLELLELGKYGQLTEQGNKRLLMAERNVKYLIKLINDLLDVEKLEAGSIELHKEAITPDELISSAIESVIDLADRLEVQIKVDIKTEHPASLDKSRMVQALVNLLSNALHYSPRGESVLISAHEYENFIVLSVRDNGQGIPEQYLSAIFERFKQVNAHAVQEKKGSGLGLAICKAIVELHGGEVGVDSKVNLGSTFWIKLPTLQ